MHVHDASLTYSQQLYNQNQQNNYNINFKFQQCNKLNVKISVTNVSHVRKIAANIKIMSYTQTM